MGRLRGPGGTSAGAAPQNGLDPRSRLPHRCWQYQNFLLYPTRTTCVSR